MHTSLSPAAPASLAAYARNVTLSHAGWNVELCALDRVAPPTTLLAGQPLRGLRLEGEDLLLEYGTPPGRARRLALTGPFEFSGRHSGQTLELRLRGPRGAEHLLRLSPA